MSGGAATGAEAMVAALRAGGVDTFFGLPGSTEAPLLEAIRADGQLRYVLGLHEGAVVSMADGYARATGRVGVVGLHTTVGTMNGMSQVYNAYRDASPLVVTAGHKDRVVLAEDGFCALADLPSLLRPFTKWSWQSLSTDAIASDVGRAIRVAASPPPGPTYLAIPEDLMRGSVHDAGATGACDPGGPRGPAGRAGPGEIRAAAELIASAARPVLVVGSAAARAARAVRALADVIDAPVLVTEFTDVADLPFPTTDPHYLGLYGEDAGVLDGCDLVLAVGCRVFYPFSAARHPTLPPGASLVHLHPDGREVGRIIPPRVGLVGDPAATLDEIAVELRGSPGDPAVAAGRASRLAELRARREAALAGERAAAWDARPTSVERLAAELHRVLPPDAVLVDEGVRSSRLLLRHLPIGDGLAVLRSSGGALGWGVPAAVGACLGRPDRPVVAVVGDGSFHFSVQAVWTAVREGASLVVVVLDNGGYLAVKRAVEGHVGLPFDPRLHPGTVISGIDHAAVAGGYGAVGTNVGDAGELAEAVAGGLSAGGVHVVAVPIAQVRP